MNTDKARQVIRSQAEAVLSLENRIGLEFEKAVETILNCRGRVIVTGMGKSGIIARKIAATLTSTGTAASYLHPAEGVHGDLGIVRREDVIIVVSKSGGTDEVYQLFPVFKRLGIPIIALLGNLNSPVAEKSDIVIDVSVTEEACGNDLIPTSSTTAALVMGDALAIMLLEERHFSPEDFALLHPGGNLGRRMLLRVEDVMHTGGEIPVVKEEDSVKDAILEMTSKRFGATCVVNRKGELVGIFTDGDLRRVVEKTPDVLSLKAKDVASPNPKVISKEALAARALNLMEYFNITCLLITDKGKKPVGIVHLHDLLKAGVV
jgi:arabinose-5-phosphate isomerase